MSRLLAVLLTLIVLLNFDATTKNSPGIVNAEYHLGEFPPGCDKTAAAQCEYEFLLCKLFNGPANDQTTLCNCAKDFYGNCLRRAGVCLIAFLHSSENHYLTAFLV